MSDPKVVLIVDDSRVSRMMIRAIVADARPDWPIVEAGDAEEAIKMSETLPAVDLMILDYNMPGMDGLTLGTHLKHRYPGSKASLLTANIQDSIRKKADDAGIEFVKKPITEEKVKAILTTVEA